MANFRGSIFNDDFSGTGDDDAFNLKDGGDDKAYGGDGNDRFRLDAALNAADELAGGGGNDRLRLVGDYSTGLVFGAATITGIENIFLARGHSYDLTTDDANVGAGRHLVVNASHLGAASTFIFDGSAESDGRFELRTGRGDDSVTGGAGDDAFKMIRGGEDVAYGGLGDDAFSLGRNFTDADFVDGGAGFDTVSLGSADYGFGIDGTFHITPLMMAGIEQIVLFGGHSYDLAEDNQVATPDGEMTVDAHRLGADDVFRFDASAENYALQFTILGGAGNDAIVGSSAVDIIDTGDGDNIVTGGAHDDDITLGSGTDTVFYNQGNESTSTTADRIHGFTAGTDRFDMPFTVTALQTVTDVFVDSAQFDPDVFIATENMLGDHAAVLLIPTSGDMAGRTFLVIGGNSNDDYDYPISADDFVIDVTGYTGTLTLGDFI